MVFFNAAIVFTALSYVNRASCNEASPISRESVLRRVQFHVRDIVGMLQTMQHQVTKDGEDDAELFGKYMFYCRRGRKAMEAAIEDAQKTDLDGIKSNIESEETHTKELQGGIQEEQLKEASAEKAILKAKKIREYEEVVFKQESQKLHEHMNTLKDGVWAIDKGHELPKAASNLLKQLSGTMDIKKVDRERLTSLLTQTHDGVSMPKSADIREELIHMTEALKKRLSHLTTEEKKSKDGYLDYRNMVRQKAHDLKADIEQKEEEIQELQTDMDNNKDTLEDASRYLMEGPAFLPFIGEQENCSKREDEWADRCEIRTSEMANIANAIAMLTDDNYMDELLQNNIPKPWEEARHHAILAAKQSNSSEKAQFDFMSLAMKGTNASFTKIFQVIDGMVSLFEKEQIHHEKYCGQSVNEAEDNLKKLTFSVSELGTVIAQHQKSIKTLTQEIDDVKAGIKQLDQEIVEGAKVRKQQHEENAETLATDNITVLLLHSARDSLSKYYSGEVPVDASEPGIAGTLAEIIGPYQKKFDDSANIIAMLDTSLSELGSEFASVEAKEQHDQDEWERVVKESLGKHASDMRAITEKQDAKADLEAHVVSAGNKRVETMKEVKAAHSYLSELVGNNTGFLKPAVCKMKKPSLPKNNEPALAKEDLEPSLLHFAFPQKFSIW
jgi:hypothetical protein